MSRHAIVITAGVGPREARAFVARLAEHLAALAAARGLLVDGATVVGDDPEAPRSIALAVVGDAPGALADQLGTHALVHRSAARGHAARKRWFAGVRCEPALPDADPAIALRADDLEISACRAGGPGGQQQPSTRPAAPGVAGRRAGPQGTHGRILARRPFAVTHDAAPGRDAARGRRAPSRPMATRSPLAKTLTTPAAPA